MKISREREKKEKEKKEKGKEIRIFAEIRSYNSNNKKIKTSVIKLCVHVAYETAIDKRIATTNATTKKTIARSCCSISNIFSLVSYSFFITLFLFSTSSVN